MKNKLFNLVCLFIIHTNTSFAQWVINNAPQPRCQFQAVVKDNKIFCIGGNSNGPTNSVDIYDTQTASWLTPQNISMARIFPATVVGDSAIYVVGGIENFINDNIGTNRVDIYKNGSWHIDSIPEKIWYAQAVHVGHKILITGGIKRFLASTNIFETSNKVHIFDELTGTWSIDSLSQARSSIAVATDGNLAIFAGGKSGFNQVSKVVDIYNATTNTWSTDSLSEARMLAAGVYADGKFYFAGGAQNGIDLSSDKVDIFDGSNWTTSQISLPRAGICAVAVNHKIFYTGGGNVDVPEFYYTISEALVDEFDIATNTWSNSYMNFDKINHTAVSHNNKVYVIGGASYSIQQLLNSMEIKEVNTGLSQNSNSFLTFYPNPANNHINISGLQKIKGILYIEIIDMYGKVIKTIYFSANADSLSFDLSELTSGMYFLKVSGDQISYKSKFIKQ
jgi:hypothetical protein